LIQYKLNKSLSPPACYSCDIIKAIIIIICITCWSHHYLVLHFATCIFLFLL